MKTLHRVLLVAAAITAAALPYAAPAAEASVAAAIARHRIEEAPTPARESPLWKAPRKVLLLDFGGRVTARVDAIRTAAAGTRFVVANDTATAAAAAVDADVIIGYNPEICDPRIINAAKQLRWLASLAAGVENCMALPAVRAKSLMMTNMRGIDAPVIAEHAIALMLALAHGLDRFAVDTSQQQWSRANTARVRCSSWKARRCWYPAWAASARKWRGAARDSA
jgi:hypothetical protein